MAADDSSLLHSDLSELLTLLGMGDHARPQSPHEVFQEALGVLRKRLAQAPSVDDMTAKAEGQVAYWRKRQQAEKCLEEGVSEDGETYTPIGDDAAWRSGYCNGRMSEADWWLKTFQYLPAQNARTGQ